MEDDVQKSVDGGVQKAAKEEALEKEAATLNYTLVLVNTQENLIILSCYIVSEQEPKLKKIDPSALLIFFSIFFMILTPLLVPVH